MVLPKRKKSKRHPSQAKRVANAAVMVRAIAAMAIAVVKTVVAAPSNVMMHARVQKRQLTAIIAAHLAKTQPVQVAPQALSKAMRAHVKAVAIHAVADVRVATRVKAGKRALTARR